MLHLQQFLIFLISRVEEIDMREIEQIVGDEFVIRTNRIHSLQRPVIGISETTEFRNARLIRARRVTHPNPENCVALNQRISFQLGVGRNRAVAMRIHHTRPRAIKPQPVIQTLDHIAMPHALGKRRKTMRAAIHHRHHLAIGQAIHQHRLAEQRAG